MFFKIGALKIFAIYTRKHLCWSLFLIKLHAWRLATLLKRDSKTGVFLWILQNFKEHIFWRTFANSCSFFILKISFRDFLFFQKKLWMKMVVWFISKYTTENCLCFFRVNFIENCKDCKFQLPILAGSSFLLQIRRSKEFMVHRMIVFMYVFNLLS